MSLEDNAKGDGKAPEPQTEARTDPRKDPAAYAEIRARLNIFKGTLPGKQSWAQLADLTGIPEGTLSQFVTGTYQGRYDVQAEKAERFFATEEARTDLRRQMKKVPGYLQTNTAELIRTQLIWGHNGNMTTVCGAPGVGKTFALQRYVEANSNVWLFTASPAMSSLVAMLQEIVRIMRLPTKTTGIGPAPLTALIRDYVAKKEALLIIDEAQELSDEAVEELRAIHDATGLGIVFCGNRDVLGAKSGKKAQLWSRNASRAIVEKPKEADVDTLLAAWEVTDKAERELLLSIAMRPEGGALRAMTQTLKMAHMVAANKGEPCDINHLRSAATHHGYRIERRA